MLPAIMSPKNKIKASPLQLISRESVDLKQALKPAAAQYLNSKGYKVTPEMMNTLTHDYNAQPASVTSKKKRVPPKRHASSDMRDYIVMTD